jgi:hypothetical protein
MRRCFTQVQVAYLNQYAHNAIALNIRRVASKQRLENSANATALILANETPPPPPKTITAVVNKQIQLSTNATVKRIQSIEDTIATERAKRQRLERNISKRFTPPPPSNTATNKTTPPNTKTTITPPVKDPGASVAGATAKKSAIRWEAPTRSHIHRPPHSTKAHATKQRPNRHQNQNHQRNHPAADNDPTNANVNKTPSQRTTTYNPKYRYSWVQKPKPRHTPQK